MLHNTRTQYGSMAKTLHWLMAILVLTMLALGFVAINTEQKPLVRQLFFVHKSLGLSLLPILLFRFYWRLSNPTPAYDHNTSRWQQYLAHITHWSFYGLLFAIIIVGWVMSSTGKHPLSFWAWFDATLPMAKNKSLHELGEQLHLILAWIIVALLSLHVAAAWWHHRIKKNNILRRMLPTQLTTAPKPTDRGKL